MQTRKINGKSYKVERTPLPAGEGVTPTIYVCEDGGQWYDCGTKFPFLVTDELFANGMTNIEKGEWTQRGHKLTSVKIEGAPAF